MKQELPEIVFGSADSSTSQQIATMLKAGKLRKLFERVYTSDFKNEDELIVRRNLWMLLSHIFPDAFLSHRSALEFQISPARNIYLTGKQRRVYKWPGLNIRITKGPSKLEDDLPLFEHLHVSSLERALLENLTQSRFSEGEKRIVEPSVIEERLLNVLNTRGENGLNQIRDRAKAIAKLFQWEAAYSQLDKMIGAILSSQPRNVLTSPRAIAQSLGTPYDTGRMELFQKLVVALKQGSFEQRVQKTDTTEQFNLIAFFEGYFSNFIEGTTFEVDEAHDIIYENKMIPNRTGDSHDIRGTYQLVHNRIEMSAIPANPEEFIQSLQKRHRIILKGRPEKNPGIFKTRPNRAGDSFFVEPQLVEGTLKYGFKLIVSLTQPFQRALFMMFLVSEVHPFDDGNGRLARVMMNSELVHGNVSKLIIPTVYREDYVLNLKKFSRQQNPNGYIAMMNKAHAFSHWLEPNNFEDLKKQLEQSNAFQEGEGYVLKF